MGSVVGKDRVDLVGAAAIRRRREVPGGPARHLLVQFDESELRGAIDCDNEIEPALSGLDLGDVDVKIADRVSLELPLE